MTLKRLDGQGRARRETARRRKSEQKVNLAIRNSSRNNATWQMTPKTVSQNHVAYGIALPYNERAVAHLASINICAYRGLPFLYVDQCSRLLENFGEDIPTNPEVIEAHTLILKPNFKFSRLNFWGDPRPRQGVCQVALVNLYSALKNFRAQHTLMAEMQSPEKCPLGFVNMSHQNFFVCGPNFT